ncbi:hypothetical protein ACIQVE_29350 [Pseudomonas sp. NPDC098747]|uniref:hypothetical protein n=1 Tax=Pseudomonas sp. NPDC098747 TaxID=3364487 RepID=UPI00383B876B
MDINQLVQLSNSPEFIRVVNDPKVQQLLFQNPQSLIDFANGRIAPAAQPEASNAAQGRAPAGADGLLMQMVAEFEAQFPEKRLAASLMELSRFVQSRVNPSTEQQ